MNILTRWLIAIVSLLSAGDVFAIEPFLKLPVRGDIYITEGWYYSDEERGIHGNEVHHAVDYALDRGEPIYAAADGWALASYQYQVIDGVDRPRIGYGYGYFVKIYHPSNNTFTLYGHLDQLGDVFGEGGYTTKEGVPCQVQAHKIEASYSSPLIGPSQLPAERYKSAGTWVTQGQIIGYAGDSGLTDGYCDYPHNEYPADQHSWDEVHVHFEVFTASGTYFDPYDIHDTRESYPDDLTPAAMGPNHLWLLDEAEVTPEPLVKAPTGLTARVSGEGAILEWDPSLRYVFTVALMSGAEGALSSGLAIEKALEHISVKAQGFTLFGDNTFDVRSIRQGETTYFALAGIDILGRGVSALSNVASVTRVGDNLVVQTAAPYDAALEGIRYPAGSVIASSTSFTQEWTIRNTGTEAWSNQVSMRFVGGKSMHGPDRITVANVPPGGITTVAAPLQASGIGGAHKGYWQLSTVDGEAFGPKCPVEIEVPFDLRSDQAAFLADLTVPDGTKFNAGESFVKKWLIENSGETTWEPGYRWTFQSGNPLGSVTSVRVNRAVAPGDMYVAAVPMTAPLTTGSYVGYWRMRNRWGTGFGDQCWVKIAVGSSGFDGIVDDLDSGFHPNDSEWWSEAPNGFLGHMRYTSNAAEIDPYGNSFATWDAELPYGPGQYQVWVFVPNNHATTQNAVYEIAHDHRVDRASVDQNTIFNAWAYLGTFPFTGDAGEGVTLRDFTSELPLYTREIGFDAVKFVYSSQSGTDGIVDELDPGFSKNGAEWWFDSQCGFGAHALFTYNTIPNDPDGNVWGIWEPEIPGGAGLYRVSAHIPRCDATSAKATYEVTSDGGVAEVVIDQSVYYDSWVALGEFRFTGSAAEQVKLVDITTEPQYSRRIAFDAIRWEKVGD